MLPFIKYENKVILGRWGRHIDKKIFKNQYYDNCLKG